MADEQKLVEAAKGDPAQFSELYTRNFHAVYAYVTRRSASREEAEDITADVFHQALANLHRFEWRGAPFAAWLMRIAANALADRWRRNSRETALPPDDELGESSMDEVEQRASLYQLVGALPDDQRRVVVLRFVEQKIDTGNRAGIETNGRRHQAIAIPRTGKAARSSGGCQ